ncbi:MAG: acyltransferase, partial [Acidobacteria bacterium]|nr:acyltransferase [Acidobacteriota bacterium]
MLDGWRGLAALAVVIQHVFHVRIGHSAVMLFFVISGYCITASATTCQKKGLGFRHFMWRRIRRIYPPYLLAVGYFVATRLVKLGAGGPNQLDAPLHRWFQNLTLTQWFSLINTDYAYAADNHANFVTAYWSLQYEEQFYLLIALMIVASLLSRRSLQWFAIPLIGMSLVWNLISPYYSHGFFIEYWLHFGVGLVLFYRLCRMRENLQRRLVDLSLICLAIVSAWFNWFAGIDWAMKRPLALELFIVSTFALLLIALRPLNDRFKQLYLGRVLMSLGAISYSLYLIHQCNLHFVNVISSRLLPASWEWPLVILQILLHILLAIPFYLFCER